MARIRSIKPEFWIDEKVVDLDPWERLLFIGIWNFADDQGYIDNKPRRIKMQVFPGDDIDVEPLIKTLVAAELLTEYDSPLGPVLHVRSWTRHQRVDKAAQPRFDESELTLRRILASLREDSTNPREPSKNGSDLPFDEPSRALASPPGVFATDLEGKGSGRDLEGKGSNSSAGASDTDALTRRASKTGDPDQFAAFYDAYPRKQGREEARKAYPKAVAKIGADKVLAAAVQYRNHVRAERREVRHVLMPATWLNGERWNDDMTLPGGSRDPTRDSRTNVSTEAQHKQGWGSDAEVV